MSTNYTVETADGARLVVYEQNIERTVHGSLYKPGEEVRLSWSPDHTFVVAGHGPGAETGGAGLIRGTDWPETLEELPSP